MSNEQIVIEKNPIPKDKNRNKLGRFVKGSNPNPNGTNGYITAYNIIEALERRGKKLHINWLDHVADKFFRNDIVLVAILKKIIPDKVIGEGFGNTFIQIWNGIAQKEQEITSTGRISRVNTKTSIS